MENLTEAFDSNENYGAPKSGEILEASPGPPAYVLWLDGIIQTVLVLIGCIGNSLTVAVYRRPKVWSSVNYYLIALSITDITLLISYFFMNSVWTLHFKGLIQMYGGHVRIIHMAFFMCNASMAACVWLTVLVTFERHLAICHPLKHLTYNNSKRIKMTLASTVLLAMLYNITKIFELEVKTSTIEQVYDVYQNQEVPSSGSFEQIDVEVENSADGGNETEFISFGNARKSFLVNRTVELLHPSALYTNQIYFAVYRVACRLVFDTVVPLAVIGILTARMCFHLFRANELRSTYLRGSKSDLASLSIPRTSSSKTSQPTNCKYHEADALLDSRCILLTNNNNTAKPHAQNGGTHVTVLIQQIQDPPSSNESSQNGAVVLRAEILPPGTKSASSSTFLRHISPKTPTRGGSERQTESSNGWSSNASTKTPPAAMTKLNVMLVMLLLKFLVCHTLPAVVTVIELSSQDSFYSDGQMAMLVTVSNLLVVLNSATNFIIFVFWGRKFRHETFRVVEEICRKIFCGQLVGKAKLGGYGSQQPSPAIIRSRQGTPMHRQRSMP